MRGAIVGAGLAVWLVLVPTALAENSGGAGYSYNPGNGAVGLNVKNSPDSGSPLTGVDFTLPAGTTLDGTPTGGGSCTATPPQQGSCLFSPGKPPGEQAFVLINTDGAKPGSIDATLRFQDGTSTPVTATECTAITVLPVTLEVATGRAPYSVQFDATGGAGGFYTFALNGVLPAGFTLEDFGLLHGTPSQAGSFSFQILAFDENGCQGSRSYTLTVQPESAGPPQSADVAIESVALGIHFPSGDTDLTDFFGALGKWFVPVAPPDEGDLSAGFQEFSNWFAGERADIRVAVTNNGPNAATFNLNVEPLTAGGLEYKGYYEIIFGDFDLRPRREFKTGLPPVLNPGRTVYLIFSTELPRAGTVTLSASLTEVSPTDSNPANDTAKKTFTVRGRTTHSDVSWKPDGAGGDITGRSSLASGSAVASAGAAARPRPIEIAVARRRGARCSWLTGRSGRLQRRPRASRCLKPVFLRAKGTRRWRYHLNKRPPKGRYTVLVRRRPSTPTQAEQQFARSLRNLFRIRIG